MRSTYKWFCSNGKVTLAVASTLVILVAAVFGITYAVGGPYTKGRLYLLRHKDVSELPISSAGYITVKIGEKFWFPIKGSGDEELYTFQDYFEVVSVLGDPNDPALELTNFYEDDIWLLIRSFRVDYPQYLILQVKNSATQGNSARTRAVLQRLSILFEKGEFIESSGLPRIKSSGIYLYIKKIEEEYKGRLDRPTVANFKGKELLEVNREQEYLPIHAKTFSSEASGQLVVLVDSAKSTFIENHIDEGWFFDHSTHMSYSLYVVFVSQEFVKSRPELQGVLPDTSGVWIDEPSLIDWSLLEEEISE